MRMPWFRAAALAAVFAFSVPAAAELMVAPTRVVFEGAERTAELVMLNRGTEAAAFRIQLENRRMLKDGSLEAAPEARPGELFADKFVRFSPARVMLDAGARQTLRISATIPADTPPGEYRSHLRLMAVPTSAGQTLQGATASDGREFSIQLVAIRSLTIPVIVRVGALDAKVQIDGAGVTAGPQPTLAVRMARTGTRSTYGDIRLMVDGEKTPAYFVRGVAFYVPNAERDVVLPLPKEVAAKVSGKRVRIEYMSADERAPGLIAATSVQL